MVATAAAAFMGYSQLILGDMDGNLQTPEPVFVQQERHCAGWNSSHACAEAPVLYYATDNPCGQ